jgi:nifR3 family TIM-barrel protein
VSVEPLHVGALTVPVPLLLAPMAGYTHAPFRAICRRYGCGMAFTEMVTAQGVARRAPRTLHYLTTHPEERPVGAHIYGADPAAMAEAARVIESLDRFDALDINCGCPVPKITSKGAGVALMAHPERIYAIVRAVSRATALPVTVKTRLGLSPERGNIDAVAQAVEEGGAQMLTIHARFATQRHSGPADWEALRRVKQARAIPIIGNGGIREAGDALAMLAQTGVDGVMVGQAAIGNPWLLEEIRCRLTGTSHQPPTLAERRAVIAEHLRELYALMQSGDRYHPRSRYTAEQAACRKFRAHLIKYLAGMRGLVHLRRNFGALDTIEATLAAVDELLERQTTITTRGNDYEKE